MKILILALAGIGDALMFTPALRLLRKAEPGAQIDILVMLKGAGEIYYTNPDINKVVHFDFIKQGFFKSIKFLLSIRKKYDVTLSVYPSNRREYNVVHFLIGAKKRLAIDYLRMNFMNFGWLNTLTIKENDSLHNVRENIRLIENLLNKNFDENPPLQLYLKEEDISYANNFLIENNVGEKEIIIGFHPGCATLKNHIKRRWEPEKFAELAKMLIQKHSAKIFLFGGPDEDNLKENIYKQINSDDVFIIKTPDLLKSAAIMKRCNVFVTNDSSLMHVSSALGLRVVAIIGPTNTNYIRPWKTEHKIVSLNLECAPCFYYSQKPLTCTRIDIKFKCVNKMDVEMVYYPTMEYLSGDKK
jgi:lipopolysaccharide heptosyltransferase II